MASYKKEADELRKQNTEMDRKIKEFEKAEAERKKGLSCMIYCSHCQTAYNASVPRGVNLHTAGCAYCGVGNSGYLITNNKLS